MLSQFQVKVAVKQVSNSPLKKKYPNFQNGLNFAFLSSYWIQFCFFSFITSARIWGMPTYLSKMGLVLKSEVWFCTISQPSEFNDRLFFVKNLVNQSNIFVINYVINIHKKSLSLLLLITYIKMSTQVWNYFFDELIFETG